MLSCNNLRLKYDIEHHVLRQPFKTARVNMKSFPVIVVTLERDGVRGRGECYASRRFGWDTKKVAASLDALPADLEHADVANLMEPGPARNAVDCAFWDIIAKQNNQRAWSELLDVDPAPVDTMVTISLMSAQELEHQVSFIRTLKFIKLKVGGPDDLATVRMIRNVAPNAKLLVDANEGWSVGDYLSLMPDLHRLGVCMIEQPLKEAEDSALAQLPRPIPLCADESFHADSDLESLSKRYDAINVKLDKMGGLTASLQVLQQAKTMGLQTVVGCMLGTSLAIAPGFLAAQNADFADLDAHLLCKADRQPAIKTIQGKVHAPSGALWG